MKRFSPARRVSEAGDELDRLRRFYVHFDSSPAHIRRRDMQNAGNRLMSCEREARLRSLLAHALPGPLSECRVLDVGCGRGDLLGWLQAVGVPPANLIGVDISHARLQEACRNHPLVDFREANGETLDFPDAAFDCVTCFTLFSSVLDPLMARNIADSILRVLKRDGKVLWYDIRYPNPWNPEVRAMTRKSIRGLFPDFDQQLYSITLIPQLARQLGSVAGALYPVLRTVPLLRSHYMGLLTRRLSH